METHLEVIASREYSIQGEVRYHNIACIGESAPECDQKTEILCVELLRNPSFNYRGTNEKMKMIRIIQESFRRSKNI